MPADRFGALPFKYGQTESLLSGLNYLRGIKARRERRAEFGRAKGKEGLHGKNRKEGRGAVHDLQRAS